MQSDLRGHVRLRHALPLIQIAIALLLRWQGSVWLSRMEAIQDMPGLPPAWQLLAAINLAVPVFPGPVYIVFVGFLWYWIARNIESWQRRKAVCSFSKAPLRVAADLLFIGIGIVIGYVVLVRDLPGGALREGFGSFSVVVHGLYRFHPLILITVTVLHLAWSFDLLFFFGRDLLFALRIIHSRRASVHSLPLSS
jgi:hypothetical protein